MPEQIALADTQVDQFGALINCSDEEFQAMFALLCGLIGAEEL